MTCILLCSLQNKDQETYVKFNWKRPEGAKYMTDDEAVQAGENNMRHSHATHDLFNWIGAGKEATWDFFIQTMDMQEGDSGKFGFDPLDCTKVHSSQACTKGLCLLNLVWM